MTRPFTLDRLDAMVRQLPRDTFWRHDVDVSLEAALEMARWENQREIHATYYLMSTSPFYDSVQAAVVAEELRGLGHQIGYHWDPRHEFPAHAVKPSPDLRVSFHCPEPHLLWREFSWCDSAYSGYWHGRYYADSRGRFAHGDPEDHPGPWPVQVNLHPEWWFQPDWLNTVDAAVYAEFFKEPHPLTRETA